MQIPSSFKIRLNWINICFKCLVRWKDLATSTVTDSFAFFLRLWNFILSKTYLVIYLHKQKKKKNNSHLDTPCFTRKRKSRIFMVCFILLSTFQKLSRKCIHLLFLKEYQYPISKSCCSLSLFIHYYSFAQRKINTSEIAFLSHC